MDAIAEGERDGFVEFTPGRYSDEMLREELARAQLVLLPYFRHHGSSGSLVCSAAAHRPVVASNYGLLAEEVAEFNLGLLAEHDNPTSLSSTICSALQDATTLRTEMKRNDYLGGRSRDEAVAAISQLVDTNQTATPAPVATETAGGPKARAT